MKRYITVILCAGCALAWLALPALGQDVYARLRNPSFENNFTEPWPFYGPIDDWQVTAPNQGVNTVSGPFHNTQTPIPDGQRVAFKQGHGGLFQTAIWPLIPNRQHWIQFRYDARDGNEVDLAVRFSTVLYGGTMDEELDIIRRPAAAFRAGRPSYYSRTVKFTPDVEEGVLTFEVTGHGDFTALIDAVTIVQRDEGNFVVQNPGFEASGIVYDGTPTAGQDWPVISGWVKEGIVGLDDGTGGMADNGMIPEQGLVAFINGEGSLSQTLSPLVRDDTYQLQFAYNAKAGTSPQLQVRVGDTVIWEQTVTPVGGWTAYRQATVSFSAASDTETISFVNTDPNGVVLLDDVKVLGRTGTALPPLEMKPVRTLVRVGQETTGTVTIPAERLALGDTLIQLRSSNPAIFVLPDATADGLLSLVFDQNEAELTKSFRVLGTGVGNAPIEVPETAGLDIPSDITRVFVAGTTLVFNPSFEIDPDSGVGPAPALTGWAIDSGNVGMAATGNPFLSMEDLGIADRRQVLRIQGSGGITQMIDGLRPGREYGLQFFYNGRYSGWPYQMNLQVRFGGQLLKEIQDIQPAMNLARTSWYFDEVRFTPDASSGLLEFRTTVTSGDATLFLDAVSIVPRLPGEITIMNSSFEGSAMGVNWPGYVFPDPIAGWSATGGYGINAFSPTTFFVEPFLDNGINSDQDNVFFGQGASSISQTLSGLTSFQPHTLVVDYNARDGRSMNSTADPNLGQIEVLLDQAVVYQAEFTPVDTVSPWPGYRHRLPFYQAFIPFTPNWEEADLQISHVQIAGDETLLIDNVRVVPGTRTRPVITQALTEQSVNAGETAVFTVVATGSNLSYRWLRNGVDLADGPSITGLNSPTLTLQNVQPAQAGTYSVLVTDGLGVVGSAAALTVIPSTEDVELDVSLVDGLVLIAWPIDAGNFRLQFAPALPAAAVDWQDEPTPAVENGPNWEVRIDPTEAHRFYRLTQ